MRSARPERVLGIIVVLGLAAAVATFVALQSARPDEMVADDGGPDGPTEAGEVVRVVDGDTVVVRINGRDERVRYIGLDAPEVANVGAGTLPECGGNEARDVNEDLVAGRRVVLERDVSDRDRFGRLLRHAWLEGDPWRLVGRELVEAGAVEARSYPPDTTRDAELDAAERAARGRGAGIWGACR